MKSKPNDSKRHRERERIPPWRNARPANDNELMVPAPILTGQPDSSTMALVPYDPAVAAARIQRPTLRQRAVKKVQAVAQAAGAAVKPELVNPINMPHLLQVAAGAGGGIAASLAAHQWGDDVGAKRLAYLLIVAGAAGSIFFDKHWQRIAAGVLASGTGQLSQVFLTEHARAKLEKEARLRQEAETAAIRAISAAPAATAATAAPPPAATTAPPPAATTAPPRNAYGFVDQGTDLYAAVDRAHRAVDGYAYGARNQSAYGDAGADFADVYAYAAAA